MKILKSVPLARMSICAGLLFATAMVQIHFSERRRSPEVMKDDLNIPFLKNDGSKQLNNKVEKEDYDGEIINEELAVFEELMRQRVARVEEVCRGRPSAGVNLVNFQHFRALRSRQLFYCPVYKASSSNWRSNFFDLFPMTEARSRRKQFLWIIYAFRAFFLRQSI